MVPQRHIFPPVWMTDYRSVKIMTVLGAYERTPQSLYVGGCVRNALLEMEAGDIDIATVHHPLQVIEKLKAAGIRFVPTGLDHGTLTAIIDDAVFEITTLRKDIDTDGRYAVIAFTDQWKEDAQRRDFTMNALFAAPDGAVFDPTGQGLDDLDARRVVFVGNPEQRIAEDYLRILRFFRFHARYGRGAADSAALNACKLHAEKLSKLSRERTTQELLKIIATSNAAPVLDLMFAHGVLSAMAAGYKSAVMDHLCMVQRQYDSNDVIARLSVLSATDGSAFDDYLVLSNVQKKHLADLSIGLAALKSISKKNMRALVYRMGNAAALQSYFLRLSNKQDFPDLDMHDVARYWQPPVFPVKADELIEAGISRGPLLGKKLKELEEKWIAKDFPADFTYKK